MSTKLETSLPRVQKGRPGASDDDDDDDDEGVANLRPYALAFALVIRMEIHEVDNQLGKSIKVILNAQDHTIGNLIRS